MRTLKASSIVENLVATLIIAIVFSLSIGICSNITTKQTLVVKVKYQQEINKLILSYQSNLHMIKSQEISYLLFSITMERLSDSPEGTIIRFTVRELNGKLLSEQIRWLQNDES